MTGRIDDIKKDIEDGKNTMTWYQYYDLQLKIEMVIELRSIYDLLKQREKEPELIES